MALVTMSWGWLLWQSPEYGSCDNVLRMALVTMSWGWLLWQCPEDGSCDNVLRMALVTISWGWLLWQCPEDGSCDNVLRMALVTRTSEFYFLASTLAPTRARIYPDTHQGTCLHVLCYIIHIIIDYIPRWSTHASTLAPIRPGHASTLACTRLYQIYPEWSHRQCGCVVC